jgi:hypothetical protein
VQHPQLTVKPHNVSGSLQLGDDPLHYLLIRPLICCQTQQPRQRTSQLSFAQRRAAQDSAGQRKKGEWMDADAQLIITCGSKPVSAAADAVISR